MKKIRKVMIVSAIMAMIFAVPVLAKDVSFSSENTDYLIVLLNNNAAKVNSELNDFIKVQCGPNAEAVIANQKALCAAKIASVNKECSENHIACLTQKVNDAKLVEKTRLDQLNWIKSIQGNIVSPDIITAQAQYDQAVAARAAAEEYLAAAKVKLAPYM